MMPFPFDITKIVLSCFTDVIKDLLNSFFKLIAKVLFEPGAMPSFFVELYKVFIGVGVTAMTVIVAFKVIQYMINIDSSAVQVPLGEIIFRSIKASAMILIAPTLLYVIVGQIVYPLGDYMLSSMSNNAGTSVTNYLQSTELTDIIGSGFTYLLLFSLIAVAIICFFFKMCVYHADLVLLELMSVWAAISMCADDNNYMPIWWREVLSQITTIVVQTAILVGMTNILTGTFTWYNLMLLIGFCSLLIKGLRFLRTMWYSTGTGKNAMNAGGKVATRVAMMAKLFA